MTLLLSSFIATRDKYCYHFVITIYDRQLIASFSSFLDGFARLADIAGQSKGEKKKERERERENTITHDTYHN